MSLFDPSFVHPVQERRCGVFIPQFAQRPDAAQARDPRNVPPVWQLRPKHTKCGKAFVGHAIFLDPKHLCGGVFVQPPSARIVQSVDRKLDIIVAGQSDVGRHFAAANRAGIVVQYFYHDPDLGRIASGQPLDGCGALARIAAKGDVMGFVERLKWRVIWSCAGLRDTWQSEHSFRSWVWANVVSAGLALWLLEGSALALILALGILVLAMELANTALERAVDLVSLDKSELARMAKDAGSAAVMVTALATGAAWVAVLAG